MKDNHEEHRTGGESSVLGRINRRRFLQVTGAVSAGVCLGIILSDDIPKDTADAQVLSLNSDVSGYSGVSGEETATLRHTRHRRQAMDGLVHTLEDPFNHCEHDCTAAMFAHQYKGRALWP